MGTPLILSGDLCTTLCTVMSSSNLTFASYFTSFAFKALDNLDALDLYNSRVVVYNALTTSLTRASKVYYQENNIREIYLAGCVVVLQVSENVYNYVVLMNW